MHKIIFERFRQQVSKEAKKNFEKLALEIFFFQVDNNPIYREFVQQIGQAKKHVRCLSDIPFIPVEVFRHHLVQTGLWTPEVIFRSSGTSTSGRSRHAVRSLDVYHTHAIKNFEQNICRLDGIPILALLPNYIAQGDSSLVSMVNAFMQKSAHSLSGFFMDNPVTLLPTIEACKALKRPYILWGVSYALLDLARNHHPELGPHAMVFETGGMKGRAIELIRPELHEFLKDNFSVDRIYSEYGMTELLSQAYSLGNQLFEPADTMRILIKEFNDPFAISAQGKPGVINVIDLANLDTCSFIATADIGQMTQDTSFEVLGRLDNSDLRGCNLLYTEITD
ncbi:MAG: acyl transferase [Saprospiraceae bacterium]|nr:acyl transferase [Saprospiraceae bacterium]